MFNGKILRLALPFVTYVAAAAAGVGVAAYQDARKRKQLQAADAFRTHSDIGGDRAVAADNLPPVSGGPPAPLSRTYPFDVVGE